MSPTPATSGPRTLTFLPKMQEQRKDLVTAVAWVAAQRPGRYYPGPDAVSQVMADLKTSGYLLGSRGRHKADSERHRVRASLRWLEEQGYGLCGTENTGSRIASFLLAEDLVVPIPPHVAVRNARDVASMARAGDARNVHQLPVAHPAAGHTPTPPLPRRDPAWLCDLTDELRAWHQASPQAAATWAIEAIEALRGAP